MKSEKRAQKFHYPGLGSASDWLKHISHTARPIRSNTKICVVMHHHGISALVSKTLFCGETSGRVRKSLLFSHVSDTLTDCHTKMLFNKSNIVIIFILSNTGRAVLWQSPVAPGAQLLLLGD